MKTEEERIKEVFENVRKKCADYFKARKKRKDAFERGKEAL